MIRTCLCQVPLVVRCWFRVSEVGQTISGRHQAACRQSSDDCFVSHRRSQGHDSVGWRRSAAKPPAERRRYPQPRTCHHCPPGADCESRPAWQRWFTSQSDPSQVVPRRRSGRSPDRAGPTDEVRNTKSEIRNTEWRYCHRFRCPSSTCLP